jgi:cysteine desulfurase
LIYADNASTTRISDKALERMLPFLREEYGNPSSLYSHGTKSKNAIEEARCKVAGAIGAEASEIIFTSGGSEGNTCVLSSIMDGHIVTSSIEHDSVLKACHALERKGVDITYLPVDSKGLVSLYDLENSIRSNTKLVSIMLANNEIGTIEPISEIGKFLSKAGILFHTDAVQAVGHIPVDVKQLSVDYLTASAHKFHGSKGTGFMYKRKGVPLSPLVFGGEQELGFRSGTENVAGIVSLGYALEECIDQMEPITNKVRELVEATVSGIRARIPNILVNGNTESHLPGIINIVFEGVSGESLMHLLDLKGICVSTGSSCSSKKKAVSHVLMALGLTEEQARYAIRISYGRFNTIHEAESVIAAVCDACKKIAGFSGKA